MKTLNTLNLGLVVALAMLSISTAMAGSAKPVVRCTHTVIAKLTQRLEDNGVAVPDSGSVVVYANGISQVSYDQIPGIQNSKVGEKILLCLVFVPKNCPVGDDRGKIYTATNLSTYDSWTLPNSQHSCGGA